MGVKILYLHNIIICFALKAKLVRGQTIILFKTSDFDTICSEPRITGAYIGRYDRPIRRNILYGRRKKTYETALEN